MFDMRSSRIGVTAWIVAAALAINSRASEAGLKLPKWTPDAVKTAGGLIKVATQHPQSKTPSAPSDSSGKSEAAGAAKPVTAGDAVASAATPVAHKGRALADTVVVTQEQFNSDSLFVEVLASRGIEFSHTQYGTLAWPGGIEVKRNFKESTEAFTTRYKQAQSGPDGALKDALGEGVAIKLSIKESKVEIDNVKGTVMITLGDRDNAYMAAAGGIPNVRVCSNLFEPSALYGTAEGAAIYGSKLYVRLSDSVDSTAADQLGSGWYKATAYFELVPRFDHMDCKNEHRLDDITDTTASMVTALYLDFRFRGVVIKLDNGKTFAMK